MKDDAAALFRDDIDFADRGFVARGNDAVQFQAQQPAGQRFGGPAGALGPAARIRCWP